MESWVYPRLAGHLMNSYVVPSLLDIGRHGLDAGAPGRSGEAQWKH